MSKTEFQYGGQAVIEGVMMRGRDNLAIAVRRANGEIIIKRDPIVSGAQRYPVLKWPLVRGVMALADSFTVGIKALLFSADQFMESEEESSLSFWESSLLVVVALALAIGLFVLLPLAGRSWLNHFLPGTVWGNTIESCLRLLALVGYVAAISGLKEIRRVFAYHGAEHKTINTFEAKQDLTVVNARRFPTFHPRCGTSFLLFVVVVSAIFFSFLKYENIWMRLATRLVLLPLIAGVSYEIIKFTGRHQNFFLWRWISWPGFCLQRLTTREPDDDQLEVAISALKAVLPEDPAQPEADQDCAAAVVGGSGS